VRQTTDKDREYIAGLVADYSRRAARYRQMLRQILAFGPAE
jgi:hypothetical protein